MPFSTADAAAFFVASTVFARVSTNYKNMWNHKEIMLKKNENDLWSRRYL